MLKSDISESFSPSSNTLESYTPPADQQDFGSDTPKQAEFDKLWNWNLNAFTQWSITGNPWSNNNDDDRIWYVDPLTTSIAAGAPVEPIHWTAFPNRLQVYFAEAQKSPYALDNNEVFELADNGKLANNSAFKDGFPTVPTTLCPGLDWNQAKDQWQTFGPGGPRGWLDEYCEWSVARNDEGKITRVMFTCENPEYWFTLWSVDPDKVVEIYNNVIFPNQTPVIVKDDLSLHDQSGQLVIDPITQQPAYNPLNKWNNGTHLLAASGGAMHLTSPPNAVAAEVYLAAAATLLRNVSAQDYSEQSMICCSQYGRAFRNSDPHIGFTVNQLVRNIGVMGTLTNPVGLYIQMPIFDNYELPDTAPSSCDPSQFWTITRGRTAAQAGETYDQILHAQFEVPEEYGFTVGDIKIAGQEIQWGGQIAETFHIALAATGVTPPSGTEKQTPLCCVTPVKTPNPWPQLLMPNTMYSAYMAFNENSPVVQNPMVLKPGQTYADLALMTVSGSSDWQNVKVDFPEEAGLSAEVTGGYEQGEGVFVYVLTITVEQSVTPGQKGVRVTNPSAEPGPAIPAFVTVASS